MKGYNEGLKYISQIHKVGAHFTSHKSFCYTGFHSLGHFSSNPYSIWSHKPIIDVDHKRQGDVDFLQGADEELTHSSRLQTRAVSSPSLICSKVHDDSVRIHSATFT